MSLPVGREETKPLSDEEIAEAKDAAEYDLAVHQTMPGVFREREWELRLLAELAAQRVKIQSLEAAIFKAIVQDPVREDGAKWSEVRE